MSNSSTTTALIIRPADAPEIHVLECDGPQFLTKIHRFPGDFTGDYLTFEGFSALPDHSKFPPPSAEEISHSSASRIYRLLANCEERGHISRAHTREIRGRLKVLFPYCDDDL